MSVETKTAAEMATETKAAFDKALDGVKALAEDALGKAKAGETQTAEQKARTDEALTAMNGLKARLDEMEQKSAREGKGNEVPKSIGQAFVDSDGYKGWAQSDFSKSQMRADMRVKASLTELTTDAAGSVGDALVATRLPGILPMAQRRMTVRDLIMPGRMDGLSLEFVKQTGFTNSAAMVAEGGAKPASDIKLELTTTSAKVIAHTMKASKQALSDISLLKSLIDGNLLYGLKYKEEEQLLNGDGTGQNLNGIVTQATAYAAAISLADLNKFDVLRLAMLQAALAEYPATGHILHPTDWAEIETLKDSQGRYIIGNPQGTTAPTLWGLPVVSTQAMTQGDFLTGAFMQGAQLFDRWDARVETGYENDDFTKNMVTILAEERVALAVYRPEAFITGDFATALAA